ncbi:hypothetical protein LCGC14_2374940 [marine sediment metagenome]|uniref:Uncharacterized protein n=1 Tax=marine sediment metagenome TaxID=412755 RepID=A0A0F9C2Q7_9ZZZZ
MRRNIFMNEQLTKPIEPMIPMVFETVTEHRGRTLYEQQSRHKQATRHDNPGKLQVREEEMKIVGAGIRQRRIIVFQECLDCKPDRMIVNVELPPISTKGGRVYLESMSKNSLLEVTKSKGLPGNKQTSKTKLIDTIMNSY